MTATLCPSCQAPATGRFCSNCGATLDASTCLACQAPLTPGAKFCHRCGTPAGQAGGASTMFRRGKAPWIVAGVMSLVLLGWVIYRVNRGVEMAPPPAGRSGGANPAGEASGPPDLSQMSGREAFLRLHDRIMGSLEQGDTASAAQFTPMALQAYQMLTPAERDIDIRYHAATLMLGSNDLVGAQALADSLGREAPGHLFVTMLRAGIAEGRNDPAGAKRAYRQFLADWDRQVGTGRQEYIDHRPLLDAFKERAETLGR